MVRTVEEVNELYKLFLGRELNTTERNATQSRIDSSGGSLDRQGLSAQIIASAEFFGCHREKIWRQMFSKPCVVAAQTPLGQEVFTDLRQLHLDFAIANGSYEPAETAFVLRFVKRGMTVFDVGANLGYFTVMMSALVGQEGRVHAFEPMPEPFGRLCAAISRNGFGAVATAHNFALGNQPGEVDIVVERESLNVGSAHIGGASDERGNLVHHRTFMYRLDDVLCGVRPDFVKIDVEGAEPLVFSGGEQVLKQSMPTMMLEINEHQLKNVSKMLPIDQVRQLLDMGYSLNLIDREGNLQPLDKPERQVAELPGRSGFINLVATPAQVRPT